jgi:hypothetical protein
MPSFHLQTHPLLMSLVLLLMFLLLHRPLQWTEADVVGASDLMFTSITGQASLLQGGVKRAALQLLLQVVGAAHPVARWGCRQRTTAADGVTCDCTGQQAMQEGNRHVCSTHLTIANEGKHVWLQQRQRFRDAAACKG